MRTISLFLLTSSLASGCSSQSATGPLVPTPSAPACDVGLEVDDCAPDFELSNADGTPVRLSQHLGERVVIVGSSLW